jgi:hypothetical protein
MPGGLSNIKEASDMPVQVSSLLPGNGVWPFSMPPTKGGFQYYVSGALLARGNTATVPTAREVGKVLKAMQKQIDSLQKEVTRLKAVNKATSKKKR